MAGGRPTKYKEDYARQGRFLAEKGMATDEMLSEFFQVSVATINNWKRNHPDFLASVKEGKRSPDDAVERSLFERATGASHLENKVVIVDGEPQTVTVEKHYPPDTAAAFIWLKNRRPEKWRDKQEIDHSGTVNLVIDGDDKDL